MTAIIKSKIAKYKAGLISLAELNQILHEGIAPVHGAYDARKGEFVGYDYDRQEWIEFVC